MTRKTRFGQNSIGRRNLLRSGATLGVGALGGIGALSLWATEDAVAVDADFVVTDLSHAEEDPDAVPVVVSTGEWSYSTDNGSVTGIEVELLVGDAYDSWTVVDSESLTTSSASGSSSFDFDAAVDEADEFDADDFAPERGETLEIDITAAVRLRVLGVGEDYSYGSGVYTVENTRADLDSSVTGEGELTLDD